MGDELHVSQTFLGKTQPELLLQTPGGGVPQDTSRLERGTSIGRYIILEQLGEGGMGCVYAAYDPGLDRRVALKLLKPDFSAAAPEEAKQRLLREAQAMARLNHANVITVHDVGAMGEQVFVAMEMVKGGTLRGWFHAEPRTPREVLALFALAGEGLWAAHGAGLVHRDFKPENVLVGADGRVRVTDFGLARSSSEALLHTTPAAASSVRVPLSPLTLEGAVMGTPAYMAPEQLMGRPTDARTDQFSFAVALYEALFGERPFAGATLGELRDAMARGEVRPLAPHVKAPVWMRGPLLRALKVNPLERWPSMRELLDALAKDPRAGRRRALWAGLALCALAGAGFGTRYVLTREQVRCAARSSLEGVWDGARRDAARAAFLGSGATAAQATFDKVSARLDALAASWSQATTQLCLDEGASGATALAPRASCLERRHDELQSVTDLLARADKLVVGSAVGMVMRVADAKDCAVDASRSQSARTAPVPASLRARLARGRVLAIAGKFPAAKPLIEGAVTEAQALGNQLFLAQAMDDLAYLQNAMADPRAPETYLQAIWAAEAARNDEQVATLRIQHFAMLGFGFSRLPEARAASREARAAVDRLGGNAQIEGFYDGKLADLLALEGKYDEALPLARRALELSTKALGEGHPDTLDNEAVLVSALVNAGRYAEAIPLARKDAALNEALYGPEHRLTSTAHNALGLALFWSGDDEGARGQFEHVLAADRARLGDDDAGLWLSMNNLAETLQHLGRHEQALALYEEALRLVQTHNSADAEALAELYAGIARSHLASGDPTHAVPLLEKSLALRQARPGERANLAENELSLADALWQMKGGDRERARDLAKAARKLYEDGGAGDAAALQRVDKWIAAHR